MILFANFEDFSCLFYLSGFKKPSIQCLLSPWRQSKLNQQLIDATPSLIQLGVLINVHFVNDINYENHTLYIDMFVYVKPMSNI